MKNKCLLAVAIMAMVLSVNIFAINKLHATTTDTQGPTIHSISIDRHNFNPGNKVALNFDIEDDISGINYVYLGYYDGSNRVDIRANYSSGAWSINIPQNMKAGTYELETISATDNAGNSTLCATYMINTDSKFQLLTWNMDLVISVSSSDTEPPVVSEVIADKTDVSPGEIVTLKAKITDNSSGVKPSATLGLKEVGVRLGITWINMTYDSESGYHVGKYTAKNVTKSYELNEVIAYDNYDNRSIYFVKGINEGSCIPTSNQFCALDSLVINVTGGAEDNNAPIASKVYFGKDKVSAPSTITAYIKASDDVSGLSGKASLVVGRLQDDGTIAVNSSLGAILSDNMTYNSDTGLYEGRFNVDQYNTVGKYIVTYISLEDNAGNEATYKTEELPDPPASFEIVDSLIIDLVTSTSVKDVAQKIQGVKDYANIMIDSTNNSKISKEIFGAIKGTNKTIYIETAGIQWVFNGKDITTLKDIDVTTSIKMISEEDTYDISGIFDKAIVVSFAENGELPGRALVRLKADYAFRNYIGIKDLMVYYFNEDSKNFSQVKLSTTMTENGFYEFYINHNSSYVITNKKPDDKYISKDLSDLALNDSSVVSANSPVSILGNLSKYLPYIGIGLVAIAIAVVFIIKKKNLESKGKVAPELNKKKIPNTEAAPSISAVPKAKTEPEPGMEPDESEITEND